MAENTGLVFKMYTDLTNYSRGLKKAGNELDNFNKHIGKIGGMIAGAFSVAAIASFTREVVNLAAEAEPVQKAFERIGGGAYLDDLRSATRNTVSDLELMKRAVAANNFQIPLESLAGLFEFARRRAEETGQSVDYLVNSIVTGIGRKSPLILDNLGISAVALKEKLNGVSTEAANISDVAKAVGQIAQAELAKMGDESVTTQQKIASITTEWQNIKLAIGEAIAESGVFSSSLEGVQGIIDRIRGRNALRDSQGLVLFASGGTQISDMKELDKLINNVKFNMQALTFKSDTWIDRFLHPQQAAMAKNLYDQLSPIFEMLMRHKEDLAVVDRMMSIRPDTTEPTKTDGPKAIVGIYNKLNEQIKIYKERLEEANSVSMIRKMREKISLLEMEKQYYDSIGTALAKMKPKTAQVTTGATLPSMQMRNSGRQMAMGSDAPSLYELEQEAVGASQLLSYFREDILATAAEGFGLMISGDMGLAEFFGGILQLTADFAKQFGKLLIEIGLAKISLEKLGVSGIGAVIAGAALIAAAGAISGLLAGAGNMQGLATGTNYVPNDGPYYLHRGEAVVPKKYNPINGGMMPSAITVVGKISGRDIYLTNLRQSFYNTRVTGS